jgi:hypothetical protein
MPRIYTTAPVALSAQAKATEEKGLWFWFWVGPSQRSYGRFLSM